MSQTLACEEVLLQQCREHVRERPLDQYYLSTRVVAKPMAVQVACALATVLLVDSLSCGNRHGIKYASSNS